MTEPKPGPEVRRLTVVDLGYETTDTHCGNCPMRSPTPLPQDDCLAFRDSDGRPRRLSSEIDSLRPFRLYDCIFREHVLKATGPVSCTNDWPFA